MNLTNFLKQIDNLTAHYTAGQLISFIHDYGRVLPEGYREDFLMRLKSVGKEREKVSDMDIASDSDFEKAYQCVRNNLKLIDSQEISIDGILNEEYDDWYDSSDDEFIYEDNDGISDMLAEACDFVHTSMDREKYEEGFEVGRQLGEMRILCTSEYDDEDFSIEDMVHYELLSCDLKQVALDALYCAYHAVSMEKRPEIMYGMIGNFENSKINLEDLMQHGDKELPDFQRFLTLWIAYAGERTGYHADRLFSEAAGLLDDASHAAGYARRFVSAHPGLYLKLLENDKITDWEKMASVGLEGMKTIPKKYVMRSKVALKTADYVRKADAEQPLPEACYFAAYESDTSALNYMRALLNGYGGEAEREALKNVFMAFPAGNSDSFFAGGNTESERKENKPDRNMILLLRFLDGQFADVLAEGLNKSEALGWSGTFMKQGLALYLLCLYEGKWQERGIAEMARIVKGAFGFSAEKYQNGLPEISERNEDDLFCDLFLKWKSIVPMAPDIRELAMAKITKLMEKRTAGIMDANRRNYYGECAAYIAALGEVQESLGDRGAKQRLMDSYRNEYPRRSAFRSEMQAYGWRDARKK